MPRVSVIIPTYNRRQFLKEAIDSVLNQTFKDVELIVVDDGSTDGTEELVSAYGKKIRYIWQMNKGPAAARNKGTEIASGEYIAFLDSDDLWLPRKLEKQIDFFNLNPEAKICYTDEIWIKNGIRVNPKKKHAKYSGWIYPYCLPLCIISPSSVLIKRELWNTIEGFDENFFVCEDYELWLRIGAQYPIFFLPDKLIIKRGGHPDQLSKRWGMDIWRIKALIKVLKNISLKPEWLSLTLEELRKKTLILLSGFEKRKKFEENAYIRLLTAPFLSMEEILDK